MKTLCVCAALLLVAAASGTTSLCAQKPITLSVDLTDAPRRILHATETLPVQPGPMTLVYPEWIPGEHGPTGPILDQAGFMISTATGERVPWVRDPVDMYTYHLTVPAGTTSLTAKMDFLATAAPTGFSAGASTSANLALLSWNQLVVYPGGSTAAAVMVSPSLRVPEGWQFATALERTGGSAESPEFATVSLEQLVDSPVLTGRWFREIALAPEVTPKHFLDIAADGPEDLALSQEHIDQFSKLVRQAGALYKSHHYGSYHFLVTLSDQVAHFGLEHHQSSDDRLYEKSFVDEGMFLNSGSFLPHEFTHSWNGKYRRPAGLATANYQEPMKGNLLWVYEGLTEYFSDVLATRSDLWNAPIYRDRLAAIWGEYDAARPGREWRNLQDTATAAQVLNYATDAYANWRRGQDYYDEGELLWLEVDCTLRQKSDGKKSLNDFAALFYGPPDATHPVVVTYTFDDIVRTLNQVVPNDWESFLRSRLDALQQHAPETPGLNSLSGYRLIFAEKPAYWSQLEEAETGSVDTSYSLGLVVKSNGEVTDTIINSPAYKAGLAPGFTVVAVNGRAFQPALLHTAIQDAKGSGSAVEMIVSNTGYYKVIRVEYHGGERYPQLERVPGTRDFLDDILEPIGQTKK